MGGLDGYHILSCEDKYLDINNIDYIWDNKKFELPRQQLNYAIGNTGNVVQGNENCKINQDIEDSFNVYKRYLYLSLVINIITLISITGLVIKIKNKK